MRAGWKWRQLVPQPDRLGLSIRQSRITRLYTRPESTAWQADAISISSHRRARSSLPRRSRSWVGAAAPFGRSRSHRRRSAHALQRLERRAVLVENGRRLRRRVPRPFLAQFLERLLHRRRETVALRDERQGS